MKKPKPSRMVAVRLDAASQETLETAKTALRASVPPGMAITDADAVREGLRLLADGAMVVADGNRGMERGR